MAKIEQAIDLNTGALLNTATPNVFRSMSIQDNFFPIEVDEEGRFQIRNNGTAESPCVLTIIPKTDVLLITVEGLAEEPLTFRGVKAGQTLIFDGVNKQILIDGKDGIENFDGWEFPKLKPGLNNLKINDAYKMFISVAVQPRYI